MLLVFSRTENRNTYHGDTEETKKFYRGLTQMNADQENPLTTEATEEHRGEAKAGLPRINSDARASEAGLLRDFSYPTSTKHQITIVEHHSLSGSDGTLRIVEGDKALAVG